MTNPADFMPVVSENVPKAMAKTTTNLVNSAPSTTTPTETGTVTQPTTTILYASSSLPDTLLAPTRFTGEAQSVIQNEDWWSYFKRFARYKKLPEANQLELLGLLFSNQANEWFQSLKEEDRTSMDKFERAFRQTYLLSDQHTWRSGIQLFETPQKVGESIDAYMSRLKRISRHIDISDQLLQSAILHGIRPATRALVLMHGVQNLETTIKNIRLVEANQPADPSTTILLDIQRANTENEEKRTQQLDTFRKEVQGQLQSQMTALQEQLKAMTTVADINANIKQDNQRTEEGVNEWENQMRPRSFSTSGPPMVRFQNTNTSPPARRQLQDSPRNRQRMLYRENSAGTNGPYQQQRYEQQEVSRRYNGPPRREPWRRPMNNRTYCENCGRNPHDSRHLVCPAQNLNCWNCFQKGHLSAFCKGARRPQ